MPWDEPCLHCHRTVVDGFLEWYLLAQQQEIGKQKLAIDCPWCKEAVVIRGLRVVALPPSFQPEQPVRREYQCAEAWAKRYGCPSFDTFLQNPDPQESRRAQPFRRGYWPHVDVSDPPAQGTQP